MYTVTVPVKNLFGKPRNVTHNYNLFEGEVIKLLNEFKAVFEWIESLQGEDEARALNTVEAVTFYTNFEEILLASYGVPSEDGMSFDHSGRYQYADTVGHNAYMMQVLTDPGEAVRFLEEMLPKDMDKWVKKADEGLLAAADQAKDEDVKAELVRLRAQVIEMQAEKGVTKPE